METIGFTFNDFYLVIHPFKFSGMNGVIAVIEDAISIVFQRVCKLGHRLLVEGSSQLAPLIECLGCPGP